MAASEADEDISAAAATAAVVLGAVPVTELTPEQAAAKRAAALGRREEVQHIKCQVCKIAVTAGRLFLEEHNLLADSEKSSDVVEALCIAKRPEGRWLTHLDLQEEDGKISVVQHTEFGVCRRECFTAQRACEDSLEGMEEELLQELTSANGVADLFYTTCKKSCVKEPRKMEHTRKDELFQPLVTSGNATTAVAQEDEKEDQWNDEHELGVDFENLFPYDDSGKTEDGEDKEDEAEDEEETAEEDTSDEHEETAEDYEESANEESEDYDIQGDDDMDESTRQEHLEEVEYVKCQVCGHAVMEGRVFLEEHDLLNDPKKGMKSVKSLCRLKQPEGKWLTRLDLQQEGTAINVIRSEGFGLCRRECHVAQLACEEVLDGLEEELLKEVKAAKQASDLQFSTCQEVCKSLPRQLTGKRNDEIFQPVNNVFAEAIENVKCQVCEFAVREARVFLEAMDMLTSSPKALVHVKALCSPTMPEGRWLSRLDLQQKGGAIIVVKEGGAAGACKDKCLAAQQACEQSLKGFEQTLLSEVVTTPRIEQLKFRTCAHVCEEKASPADEGETPTLINMLDADYGKDEKESHESDSSEDNARRTESGCHAPFCSDSNAERSKASSGDVGNAAVEMGKGFNMVQFGSYRVHVVHDDGAETPSKFIALCNGVSRVVDGCGFVYIIRHSLLVLTQPTCAVIALAYVALSRTFGAQHGLQFLFYVLAWCALHIERRFSEHSQENVDKDASAKVVAVTKTAEAAVAKQVAMKQQLDTVRTKNEERNELAKREVLTMRGALQTQKANMSQMEEKWLDERDRRLKAESKLKEVEAKVRLAEAMAAATGASLAQPGASSSGAAQSLPLQLSLHSALKSQGKPQARARSEQPPPSPKVTFQGPTSPQLRPAQAPAQISLRPGGGPIRPAQEISLRPGGGVVKKEGSPPKGPPGLQPPPGLGRPPAHDRQRDEMTMGPTMSDPTPSKANSDPALAAPWKNKRPSTEKKK